MDKMNLLTILAVSVPEAILNIYIAFLISGEKTHLYLDDKINILRLLIAVPLMVVTCVTVRAIVPNLVLILLINFILQMIILKFVYNFKWHKAFVNVLIFTIFLISMEALLAPVFMQITGITGETLLASDAVRIIFATTERVVQLFFIVSLWNWNRALFNLKHYKEIRGAFCIFSLIALSIEASFLYIFINNADKMAFGYKMLYIAGFLMFAVLNFYLFRFISVQTNAVLKQEMNEILEYKKELKNNLKVIRRLIENGDIEGAKKKCQGFDLD